MKVLLCNYGLVIEFTYFKKVLGEKYLSFVKSLIIYNKPRIGPIQLAKCYKIIIVDKTKYICLPRTYIDNIIKNNIIKNSSEIYYKLSENSKNINVNFIGNLFPNQNIICNWICNNIFNNNLLGGCTLDLMAGLGKTFIAGNIISRLKIRTLYIVPRKHLQYQAYNDLNNIIDGVKIGIFKPDKNDNDDITIIIINSAIKQKNEFFNKYGLVIFDEIHMYCGNKFREIFFKAQTKYVLGMTATTHHRLDNFDGLYHKLIGQVVTAKEIPGYNNEDENFQGMVKVIKYEGPDEYTKIYYNEKLGKPSFQKTISQFIDDEFRNKLIINETKKLYDNPDYYIYIFVENRKHVLKLLNLISKEFGMDNVYGVYNDEDPPDEIINYDSDDDDYNEDLTYLMGGSTNENRELATKSRIIITTYSYSGTGISYLRMNAAIFGTPRRSNYEQICRRITRKGSNINIERKYIDIVDEKTILKYQYYSRKKVYELFDYKIIKEKIHYKDIK